MAYNCPMVYWYYCSCIVMWYILGLWVQSFVVQLFLLIIITAVILMQYSVLFSVSQFCSAFSDSELISSLSAELADQFWPALSNAEWGHCWVHFQPKWLGKEEFEFWSVLIRKILWPLSADQNMWGTDKTSFEEYWVHETDPVGKQERLYSEVYSAETFIEEHKRIRAQPHEPGCNLKTVVVAIMCYSDSMHLTSFGNAALWPIYEWFGNQSKYPWGKPTSFAAQHVAYIPKVSWVIQRSFEISSDHSHSARWCISGLVHQDIWKVSNSWSYHPLPSRAHPSDLAYFTGCWIYGCLLSQNRDGMRWWYNAAFYSLLFFLWSRLSREVCSFFFLICELTIPPHRTILVCIKYLGNFLCPRCLISKADISKLGTKRDRKLCDLKERVDDEIQRSRIWLVRDWIYKGGTGIISAAVERILSPKSLIPTHIS